MSTDPYTQQADLLSEIDGTLGRMIENGLQGGDVFTSLQQTRSGVASNLPGMPSYASSEAAAQSYMQQADAEIADATTSRAMNDPEFAAAACDCVAGEPCCLRAFEVEDSSDGSRKVAWPVPQDGPNRLYVIAKDPVGGQPSAKAKVTLTDKEACKMNFARPSVNPRRHAAGPEAIMDSGEVTVTSPFQMPAFSSNILPPEALAVMYLSGVVVSASSYRNAQPATVNPYQCMVPRAQGLEIFAIPHIKASASLTGQVSATFTITRLPTLSAGLSGEVTGEVGNQTLQLTAGQTVTTAPRVDQPQGPIQRHPLFAVVDAVQSAMSGLSNESTPPSFDYTLPTLPQPVSLTLAFAVTVSIPSIEVKGKSGSPDLEVNVDPFSLSMNPSVTGSVDLLQLMLSRIPRGREIAAYIAQPGNVLRASAQCTLTLRGSGDVAYRIQQAVQVTISNTPGWEQAFSNLQQQFEAGVEFTGSLVASARIDLETWFISASAAVGGSVSTGWRFRGRATDMSDGTVKFEKQRIFQGIELEAYATAEMGASVEDDDTQTFDTGNAETFGTSETTSGASAQSNMGEGRWRRVLMVPEGSEDEWIEI
ncbi:hypothetical protein [uncultured Tateyamaria sp.]|uniref:hypothetical protein n=1 Tax=Tateyamaria sp. 1078 TaxID=3417464 RepID=UPI002619FCAD|nr:hypothetical protein [uncultured Tateyamaria sp.]